MTMKEKLEIFTAELDRTNAEIAAKFEKQAQEKLEKIKKNNQIPKETINVKLEEKMVITLDEKKDRIVNSITDELCNAKKHLTLKKLNMLHTMIKGIIETLQ